MRDRMFIFIGIVLVIAIAIFVVNRNIQQSFKPKEEKEINQSVNIEGEKETSTDLDSRPDENNSSQEPEYVVSFDEVLVN